MTGDPRIGLDQGCPRSTVAALQRQGWDVIHVADVGMSRATDADIVAWAARERRVVVTLDADFHALLTDYIQWRQQFLDERGELLPRFQQAPMVASFMQDGPAATQRQNIPVPRGPVEVW